MAGLFLSLVLSCARAPVEKIADDPPKPAARATAILQAGGHPLWFQLTDKEPVLLESIEDACFSAALIPWPLALHIRFVLEKEDELLLAVNRGGFLKISPQRNEETAEEDLELYCFSGGTFWQQYTVGGFIFYDDKPAALLYLDDRFLNSASPLPHPRTWTFNMESNTPFPLDIPALEFFPVEEGWNADTLRFSDGYWYYRASKRSGPVPEVRMLRTANLAQAGEIVSQEVFWNSVLREPEPQSFSLPPLPEGFQYTWIAETGESLFACWEEQEDFNIGAAGFMVIKR